MVEIAGTATGAGAVAALEACYRARNRTLEAFDKARYGTGPAAEAAEAWTSVAPTGHVTDAGAEALLEDSRHCSRHWS